MVFCLACTSCEARQKAPTNAATGLAACADIHAAFFQDNTSFTPILAVEGDVNADGRADLVVLYHAPGIGNRMRVLLREGESGYVATSDHKAPVSNQSVRFRDIDDKPPLEFIVQGMKGAKSGFAIYRIENGDLVDIFGEGMDSCC